MGGKAVMALTALAPERVERLVAIDIAPVDYHVRRHDEIFAAINAVTDAQSSSRQQAASVMRQHLQEEGVIQFLLKSFVDGEWRFNVPVLWEQYPHIVGWETIPAWEHPALFIPGGNSPYVTEAYREQLLGAIPAGSGARYCRCGPLGACRKTGGGTARHPSLSERTG